MTYEVEVLFLIIIGYFHLVIIKHTRKNQKNRYS